MGLSWGSTYNPRLLLSPGHSGDHHVLCGTPMLNPFTYSLRNKDTGDREETDSLAGAQNPLSSGEFWAGVQRSSRYKGMENDCGARHHLLPYTHSDWF
jgi:hypothetical protein